ncbi:beta-L-arabinofuranosidase domain-containing protein [uncultured Bacteroides sp.]|uniref:glycoside hydrolase family 127 protein n=1 Tax=uncultured Bacteroides sp. TaxID=162156 RepID=UPI002608797C|nr:beta-L-arabinofuranosidase domain-containing protein [uncultured Bacteroides sp.]
MKKTFTILLFICAATGINAQDKLYSNEFPLSQITLLEGPLKHARDLNIETLLKYDCDRLIAPYRKEAGLTPKAKCYPNWDGLDGHVGGHYLTAMAINAATGNEECRKRMEYIISEIAECAEANCKNHPQWGAGYMGGMPNSQNIWNGFKDGDFRIYSGSWAPFYNLHKMYAGLRDAWLYCGNEQAKTLFLQFCNWAIDITSGLSDEQMERMLGNEHGGMNEVLADAYAITHEQKYLDCAKRFSHKRLFTPMSQRQDCLDNMHANTQVPKVIGFERISELSGNEDYHAASSFFWDVVTGERSLAFGGNSRREHFPAKDACMDFINDIDGPESCNTNNMLKLTEDLHRHNPEARYADYYELATFNHILSTQHPEHGGYVYFTPARPRHYRNYSAPNEAMWCCVGTGMENHGKYGQFIYTHVGDALFVNLYAASQLDWKERGITLRQETAFPYSENSTITIAESKGTFNLMVRYPGWVHPGEFKVSVNGKPVDIITGPSSYVSIHRKWKKGDVVNIHFPMHSSLRYLPNEPQYVALMHGPILLGMKTGTESMTSLIADDSRFGQYAGGPKQPIDKAPILINNDIASIPSQLTPVPGKPLHFTLSTRMENKIEGELQPFFEIHDSRYMMYWLALTEGSYKQYIDNIAKQEQERQALEASTVDKVQPGEQQPETDHQMETDESYTGNTNNVFYRDARDGHYFSYLMQTDGLTDLKLRLKYWGVGEWKSHEFDIYIDDVLLRSINNTGKYRISEFKAETYDIPATLLQDKKQVRVKFVAKPNKQIGEIYEVRLIKQ